MNEKLYYLFCTLNEFLKLKDNDFVINLDNKTEIPLFRSIHPLLEQPEYSLVLDLSGLDLNEYALIACENRIEYELFESADTSKDKIDLKPLIKEIIPKNSRKIEFQELGLSIRTSLDANSETILKNLPHNIKIVKMS